MRRTIASVFVLGLSLAAGGARADAPDEAATALARGDYQAAADRATAGLATQPQSPWLHYDKGCALAALGQTDEGIAELRQAQQLFATVHDQGLALYRIAVAEQTAKRCSEAQHDYWAFARLVRRAEPSSAEIAQRASETCGVPPQPDRQQVSGRDDTK